jgi:hypothetical protein
MSTLKTHCQVEYNLHKLKFNPNPLEEASGGTRSQHDLHLTRPYETSHLANQTTGSQSDHERQKWTITISTPIGYLQPIDPELLQSGCLRFPFVYMCTRRTAGSARSERLSPIVPIDSHTRNPTSDGGKDVHWDDTRVRKYQITYVCKELPDSRRPYKSQITSCGL